MAKIKCNVCSKEKDGFCIVKKVKVHINKKRKCNAYVYDSSKLKIKQRIPTIQIGYDEQQKGRRKSKETLKELKRIVEVNPGNDTAKDLGFNKQRVVTMPNTSNTKYPLTGDLSRFTTTATKEN